MENAFEDEFKLVTSKNRKDKKRFQPLPRVSINQLIEEDQILGFDQEAAIRRVELAKDDIKNSDYYSSLKATLREGLTVRGNQNIEEIVSYGIGHFTEWMASRYQLALLLLIKEYFESFGLQETHVYDPVFYHREKVILKILGCKVIEKNEEGKRKILTSTILYFPHCSSQLLNNFLWANWTPKNLKECIIIGNSFTDIVENAEVSKHKLLTNAKYILNIWPYVDEISIVNSFKYNTFFNNTSVHVFQDEKLRIIDPDFWSECDEPQYREQDLEIYIDTT